MSNILPSIRGLILALIYAVILIAVSEFCRAKIQKNERENGGCIAFMLYIMIHFAAGFSLFGLVVSLGFYTDNLLLLIATAIISGLYLLFLVVVYFL